MKIIKSSTKEIVVNVEPMYPQSDDFLDAWRYCLEILENNMRIKSPNDVTQYCTVTIQEPDYI